MASQGALPTAALSYTKGEPWNAGLRAVLPVFRLWGMSARVMVSSESQDQRRLVRLLVKRLPLAWVMISRSWDGAPCPALCSVASLLLPLSLSVLTLSNK